MILTNAKIYLAGYDLSGDFNQVAVAVEAEEVDDTMFGDTTRTRLGGLKTAAVEGRGAWNGGANTDKPMFDRIGTANVPVMVGSDGADAGEFAYFLQAMAASYQVGGAVGDLLPFDLSAMASGGTPIVRGPVLFNGTAGTTATGTAMEAGAVTSAQKLYAALFILDDPSGTTPTLDVVIESDDGSGFASGITRITFAQQTARGAVFATPVAGPITDTHWRTSYTIGGTDPSFRFAVVMGIL